MKNFNNYKTMYSLIRIGVFTHPEMLAWLENSLWFGPITDRGIPFLILKQTNKKGSSKSNHENVKPFARKNHCKEHVNFTDTTAQLNSTPSKSKDI